MKPMRTKEKSILWIACLCMAALSFAVFYAMAQRPASDLSIHAAWAAEGSFADPRSFLHHHVHPLWHLGVGLLLLTGLSLPVAAALVTMLWKCVLFWASWALCRRLLGQGQKWWQATVCALVICLVSSVCIPWFNPTVYLGAGTPNTWHSPTQMAVLPFSVACLWVMAQSYDRFEKLGPEQGCLTGRQWLGMAALFALSALAKPTFLQAFLPAAALFFLVQWIRQPQGSKYFWQLIGAMVPSLLVMALQFYYYFLHPTDTGIQLDVSLAKTGLCVAQLLVMALFPLFALVTDREKKDTLVILTVWNAVSALIEMMLLGESGRRSSDGNFIWAMMGSAFLLWAVMLPRFVRQQRGRGLCPRSVAGGALIGWHLLSGLYYIGYLLLTGATL